MLTEQRHRIRRQVLELTTWDEATAERLRSELGRIQSRRLAALIDRCLTEASAPDRLHRIGRLEVDLGRLDPERLEHDLVDTLGVRLRQALTEHLREAEQRAGGRRAGGRRAGGSDGEPGATSQLELLDVFVRTGRLPWWTDASQPRLLQESLEHLVRHAPRPLAAWLPRLPQPALQRLVLHLDDQRLVALCGVLVNPSQAPLARPAELVSLLGARRAVPGSATPQRYRAAVWQAVLRTVCREGSRDAQSFWSTVLARVAAQLGITLATLVEGLRETLGTSTARPLSATAEALGTIVESLAREASGEVHGDQSVRELEEIRQILARLGRSPSPPTSQEPARQETELAAAGLFAALGALAQRLPAAQRGRWLAALRDLDCHRREGGWAASATARELLQIVRLAVDERLLPADVLRRHLAALLASSPTLRRAPEMPELRRLLRETVTGKGPDDAAEGLEASAEPSTFSDADTAYVDNAGLVVLWPFLGHFFEHLGLMTGKVFHDEAARHRAVGLLQVVAAEDPAPPEYLLALNKVLCGMAVGEVFELGAPITEAEAEECANLLAAAIGHAPILGDMSHAGFRGSFLLRRGALSVEGGAWLLRVERETYDVVLDRFPWSLDWVRLPWMEAPLRVEW